MAEVISRAAMPKRYTIYATGDWHFGSKACHVRELQSMLEKIEQDDHAFMIFMGDGIEGKPVGSKHFDPNSLDPDFITIEQQIDGLTDMVTPLAKTGRVLVWAKGNHDIYLSSDFDVFGPFARHLGLPLGGYQTWLGLRGLRGFLFHGRRSMPRGAKDPIQRDANQRAWLARELDSLGPIDAHFCLMGHVHTLHVQPPIPKYGLVMEGDRLRARWMVEAESEQADMKTGGTFRSVPKESRWYAVTGTFRRSGGPGYVDYSEIAGYPPAPIGYQVIEVEDDRIISIEPVIP